MSGIFDDDLGGVQPKANTFEVYRQQQLAEAEARRALIRAVFETPAGQELLACWRERVLAVPSYVPGRALDECAHVEGQKQIVREIEAAFGPPLSMERGA